MQRIIDAGNKEKKKNVVLVIKSGEICKEFVTSLSDVLLSAKRYAIRTYMSEADHFDEGTREFCDKNETDLLIFVQPAVGFCPQAIAALVEDCSDLQQAYTCVAVPRKERSFSKVLSSLKERGAATFDERELESLTSIFDIKVKNNRIHLDDKGRFECDGFQPHDIVCMPLSTMHAGVDQATVKKFVHTRFTTTNGGTCGCLLDHLKHIIN